MITNLKEKEKCYGCGTTENLELTKYVNVQKKTWYDSKRMANITEKTTTRLDRPLCSDCIRKAETHGKKVVLMAILLMCLGIAFILFLEIFQAPGFYTSFFTSSESQFDYLDLIPFGIIGIGIYVGYYGNKIKTQPSRHYS